jgi:hypothetical protein
VLNKAGPKVLEGFTESLRFELDPTWNIKVLSVIYILLSIDLKSLTTD